MSTTLEQLFLKFRDTIAALRDPVSGCPWDLEQDHRSLRPYLLEEAHEVLEAIDAGDDSSLCDELGDLLLQVVLHSQLAAERKAFTLADVIRRVDEKMIRRHPHVFGETTAADSGEVLRNWEQIKAGEKAESSAATDLPHTNRLRGIPKTLPSLTRAQRIGEKAASCNFDWVVLSDVWSKVQEELEELQREVPETTESLTSESRIRLEHELGDLLFALAQYARWLGISAEESLRSTCERFILRFSRLENLAGSDLKELSVAELERRWQEAKRLE